MPLSPQSLLYCSSLLFCLGCAGNLLHRQRSAVVLLIGGAAFYLLSIVVTCSNYGVYAISRAFTQSVFLPCCFAFIAAYLLKKESAKTASLLAIPACIFTLVALLQPFSGMPPCPMMRNPSVPLCFFFQTLAVACFFAGGFYALLFLFSKQHEKLFQQLVVRGFLFYTLAQLFGAFWSYLASASPFAWTENHLQTAAVWLLYCGYLHLQYRQRSTIRGRALWAVWGAVIVLVITVLLPLPATISQKLNPPQKAFSLSEQGIPGPFQGNNRKFFVRSAQV